jgi:hypothetical protein
MRIALTYHYDHLGEMRRVERERQSAVEEREHLATDRKPCVTGGIAFSPTRPSTKRRSTVWGNPGTMANGSAMSRHSASALAINPAEFTETH